MTLRGSRTLWVTPVQIAQPANPAHPALLSILLAVVLAAAIAGIPTLWLIHQQLDRQAWAQVDGGLQAARALYDAKQEQISNLARLAAQRPSLPALLAEGDVAQTLDYLRTLQSGEGVDLIVLCDSQGQALVSTGKLPTPGLCQGLLQNPAAPFTSSRPRCRRRSG